MDTQPLRGPAIFQWGEGDPTYTYRPRRPLAPRPPAIEKGRRGA